MASGEITRRLPLMWPGFKSWRWRHARVGWVCCWFSPLLPEVFLRVLGFSPLLKKTTFSNSNSTRNQRRRYRIEYFQIYALACFLNFESIIQSRLILGKVAKFGGHRLNGFEVIQLCRGTQPQKQGEKSVHTQGSWCKNRCSTQSNG